VNGVPDAVCNVMHASDARSLPEETVRQLAAIGHQMSERLRLNDGYL
jgi:hypothetical protein